MRKRPRDEQIIPQERRKRVALGLLRSFSVVVALVILYYLLPLDHSTNVAATLTVGLVILLTVTALQLRAVTTSADPDVRAVEALATTLPLFLLLFAAAYHTMAAADAGAFSSDSMTRTDALYLTVTIFTTVGFGDISALSQTARVVVTVQMLLDLVVLGFVVQVFLGAVRRAKQQAPPVGGPASSPREPREPRETDDAEARHRVDRPP